MTVHCNKFLFNKTNRRTNSQIYSGTQLYMFRTAPLPIIRSYPLYIRHWHILWSFDERKRWLQISQCEPEPSKTRSLNYLLCKTV